MMDYTQEITAYFDRLKVTIDKISKSDLSDLMNVLVDAKESGKQIYANDLSFEDIFVEQLKNFYQKGDIVIGISGSGNSINVLKAIDYANEKGGVTVGLTGYSGGKLIEMAQHNVHIPIDDMQIAEDLHMVLDHCMMKILSGKGY